jgi:hypothetical protein
MNQSDFLPSRSAIPAVFDFSVSRLGSRPTADDCTEFSRMEYLSFAGEFYAELGGEKYFDFLLDYRD